MVGPPPEWRDGGAFKAHCAAGHTLSGRTASSLNPLKLAKVLINGAG